MIKKLDTHPPFQLHTDWNMFRLGAMLTQKDDHGKEYVIAYASKKNNECKWDIMNHTRPLGDCLLGVSSKILLEYFEQKSLKKKFNLKNFITLLCYGLHFKNSKNMSL